MGGTALSSSVREQEALNRPASKDTQPFIEIKGLIHFEHDSFVFLYLESTDFLSDVSLYLRCPGEKHHSFSPPTGTSTT